AIVAPSDDGRAKRCGGRQQRRHPPRAKCDEEGAKRGALFNHCQKRKRERRDWEGRFRRNVLPQTDEISEKGFGNRWPRKDRKEHKNRSNLARSADFIFHRSEISECRPGRLGRSYTCFLLAASIISAMSVRPHSRA